MTGFHNDPEFLGGLARRLHDCGTALDGSTAPTVPDAGEVTGDIARALATLCSSTGGMVKGLSAIGQAVTDCAASYTDIDATEADNLSHLLS